MDSKLWRSPIFLLYAAGIAIFLGMGLLWWTKVYQGPYRVYWGMLENNLSTAGVTKRITQASGGAKLDQTLINTYGTKNTVHAVTTLTSAKSTVKTESVATTTSDSVRYTQVETSQKNKLGKPFDFSSILGKWASSKVDSTTATAAQAGLFTQTALGVLGGNLFPQAQLSAESRQDLLKRLHNEAIFDTSFSNVKKSRSAGRPIYTYTVKVEPVAYAGFEKAFAKALSLHALDELDPNQYQNQAATELNVSVDAWSHQLVSVDFPGQNHRETYTNYGVAVPVGVPRATITGAQLQSLLGKVQ